MRKLYWSYQLKKEELVLVTWPVVDQIVDSLRNALLELCALHCMQ